MQQALSSLQARLVPAEEIFFAWLIRVFAAATLVGSAWIDDAPPLEIGARIIALYVAVRVATQFGNFAAAAPFESRPLRMIFAAGAPRPARSVVSRRRHSRRATGHFDRRLRTELDGCAPSERPGGPAAASAGQHRPTGGGMRWIEQ